MTALLFIAACFLAYANGASSELRLGNVEAANALVMEWEQDYPDARGLDVWGIAIALLSGAPDRADSIASSLFEDATRPAPERITGAEGLAKVAFRRQCWK